MRRDLTVDAVESATVETIRKFEQAGCLKLVNFIDQEKIAPLRKAVLALMETAAGHSQAAQVGTARYMAPLPVSGALASPDLYAPASLSTFFSSVLGESHVLNCFTCINARPGAPQQHIHRDYEGLFASRIDSFCPSFAINLFVPLVPFGGINGTTRVWPGSHRRPDMRVDATDGEHVDPELELGSALLVDYRTRHAGTANKSEMDRPLLCLGYSRDWFLDTRNFRSVDPLQIEAKTLERMDQADRHLFSRAVVRRDLGTA